MPSKTNAQTLTPDDTLTHLRTAAVSTWWHTTSFISIEGADAVSVVDGLVTQAVADIPIGTAQFALFLTNKARIIAPALIHRTDDQSLLLEVMTHHAGEVFRHVRRYKLRAQATVTETELTSLTILGHTSQDVARTLIAHASDCACVVTQSPAWGVESTTIVAPVETIRLLVAAAPDCGAPHADGEALDAARMGSGTLGLGEFVCGFMPAEVGAITSAVNFDKGCYLGQEPVARLHWRGKANRNIRFVHIEPEFPADHSPADPPQDEQELPLAPGSMPPMSWLEIGKNDGSKPLGWLVSWARGADGSTVGFAVVRREVDEQTRLVLANTSTEVVVGPVVE